MYHDGDYSWEDPLVPIPNTTVKLSHVDDIWLETARENRSLPSTLWELVWYEFFFLFFVSSQIDRVPAKQVFWREEEQSNKCWNLRICEQMIKNESCDEETARENKAMRKRHALD